MNETSRITPPEMQVCKCCGRELPVENFGRAGFGFRKTCRECVTSKRLESIKMRERDKLEDQRKQVAEARQLRLSDFQPRELMIRLRELGYEGTLTYTQRHEIDIAKVD